MYGLKIAGMDQISFGPVRVLVVVKIICSTVYTTIINFEGSQSQNFQITFIIKHQSVYLIIIIMVFIFRG